MSSSLGLFAYLGLGLVGGALGAKLKIPAGALIGAMLYEGLADTPEEAIALGPGLGLSPCHHHRAVGPMAGVVSPSMLHSTDRSSVAVSRIDDDPRASSLV